MENYYLKNYDRFVWLCWGILYLTQMLQFLPQTSLAEALVFPVVLLAGCYPIATYLSKNLLHKAMLRKRMKTFIRQFIALSAVSGAVCFAWSLLFYQLEQMDVFRPSELLAVPNPLYYFPTLFTAGFLVNIIFCGLRFYEENLKFQKQLNESQLYALKAQINPHFMFNVLNHLHYYVENGDKLASVLLLKYSDMLRYQLYSGKKETVPLEEEIRFLQNYIEIERMRWEDKVEVKSNWETENPQLEFLPLILITPVENAFKHVSHSQEQKGYVSVSLRQNAGTIRLEVENSKPAVPNITKPDSGLGLENLRKRLDIAYHGRYSLSINETESTYNSLLTIKL